MDWRLEPVIVRVSERQNTVRAAHAAGLGCSIAVGKGPIDTVPGSFRGVQLMVDDIEVAYNQLRDRGVDVSDVQDFPWGPFVSSVTPTATGGPSGNYRGGRETTRPALSSRSLGPGAGGPRLPGGLCACA